MRVYPPNIIVLLSTLKFCLIIVLCNCATFDPYDEPPCTTTSPPPPRPPAAPASAPAGSKWLPASTSRPMNLSGEPLGSPPLPSLVGDSTSGLQVGFYVGKCLEEDVDVEAIIANVVEALFRADPTLLPALLRLQFHDCFVSGCDASILIEGNSTEKTASPNRSVRGYKIVDDVKLAVEAKCPGLVSCADIIAVATKVLIKLGGGPDYPVQTGRRDGLVSRAKDARDLPGPFLSVEDTATAFAAKNFTIGEMVVLLGCHTVGVAHCVFFKDRLYPGTSLFDPFMDPELRNHLMSTCPQNTLVNSNFTLLDQNPQRLNTVDNSYFNQIINRRGVLPIDQELARDPTTQGFVQQLSLNATLFNIELANAMVKLQALDVLTGDQGEVRKVCRSVN
ncbi:peroxidase 57-like [Silene latifolia]|uniref:peroxidase 57-like n=1 Tax=Silene latifolia TaxID=37657 RepID=UPI003D78B1B0